MTNEAHTLPSWQGINVEKDPVVLRSPSCLKEQLSQSIQTCHDHLFDLHMLAGCTTVVHTSRSPCCLAHVDLRWAVHLQGPQLLHQDMDSQQYGEMPLWDMPEHHHLPRHMDFPLHHQSQQPMGFPWQPQPPRPQGRPQQPRSIPHQLSMPHQQKKTHHPAGGYPVTVRW